MEVIKKLFSNTRKNKKYSLNTLKFENEYIIKIIKKTNRIKFEVLKIDDEQKYSIEYNIDEFHINHNFFKNFNNINELYEQIFEKLKKDDIFILQKNENEIIFKIHIFFRKKKEDIQFIIKENNNINNFFATLYNNNEEEKALKDENKNSIKDKKNKKHHFYKNKIISIFSIIIIIACYKVIMIVEKKTKLQFVKPLNENKNYIIFFDHYDNTYINSNDAYSIFDHYRRKGRKEAYYFLLNNSQLYYRLKKENNLDNIVIVDKYKKNHKQFKQKIFRFFNNSKLIVYSYNTRYLEKILDHFNFSLKTIYLDHGVAYFKERFCLSLNKSKVLRTIAKIKPEFDSWIKHGWNANQIYKGALPRWERFNHIKNKQNAILIFFTWRRIKKINFFSSIYFKKINALFSNKNFSNYLISKKIKVFYKRHHQELSINHGYHEINYTYIYEVNDKDNFSKIIDDSSLLITDYSSLSMDFMFQNKPVIFYLLDINDKNRSSLDKYNTRNITKKMIFGNSYNSSNEVIGKMKYYIENNFTLEDDLKNKYESLFYYKKDILGNLEKMFNQIIEEK